MSVIKLLSDDLIGKIAAGEVIERPASVVKELVENSIDAGAKRISIDLQDGGTKRITVTDDGCGMSADDLKLCIVSHATSKLSSLDGLFKINSMGFRGEALASIGSVSRLSVQSRVNDGKCIEGAEIFMAGKEVFGPKPSGCPPGTKIDVADLFFNVPARMKFMRSPSVEYGHIASMVSELALANPAIRFELSESGRRGIIANAVSSDDTAAVESRIVGILGNRFKNKLVFISETSPDIFLRGWICQEGRSAGKDIHIFLNGRPIRDRILIHAVVSSFGINSRDSYPAAVLWLDIDAGKVDVNVHPTKREVRFENASAVHDFVHSAIKKSVSGISISPTLNEGTKFHIGGGMYGRNVKSSPNDNWNLVFSPLGQNDTDLGQDKKNGEDASNLSNGLETMPLGQIGMTYIVCETREGDMVIIDQHAAHERIGYDKLVNQSKSGGVAKQILLIPERIELDARSASYILDAKDILASAGFEVEGFGGGSIIVKEVPSLLEAADLKKLFDDIANQLEEIGRESSVDNALKALFARMACHTMVRGGDRLSKEEQIKLLDDIKRFGVTHCPHGRPVMITVSNEELAKWFDRSR